MGCTLSFRQSRVSTETVGPSAYYVSAGQEDLESKASILLLGASNSGKSTLLKQMQIIHTEGFSENERRSYSAVTVTNVIDAMQSILSQINIRSMAFQKAESIILNKTFQICVQKNLSNGWEIPVEILPIIRNLWKDSTVRHCLQYHRDSISCAESAEYFLPQIARVMSPGFIPNDQDILHSRVRTTGIREIQFRYQNSVINMIDVGGQSF